jgi:peptidoglycan/LPS O-acetylase OafA/YrhL
VAWCMGLDFAVEGPVNKAPWPQLAASLVNLQLLTAPFPNFGPSWSITCEVVYYAVWPLVLILMHGQVTRAAISMLFAAMMGVASIFFVWHAFHILQTSTAVHGLWTVCVLFPCWICGAWLGAHWESVSQMVTRRMWYAAVILSLAVMILEWVLRFKHYPGWARHFTSWGAAPGLLFALAGARHVGLSTRSWAQPCCRWLGLMSYPCYILHIPLLMLIHHAGDSALPSLAAEHPVLLTVLETCLVLLALSLLGPPLERFFMSWRSRFLRVLRQPRLAAS